MSKFWVCIALISVAVAHTYVYKDMMTNSGSETSIDVFNNILASFKNEMRLLLTTAKSLSRSARQGIDKFRKRTSQWRFERGKKLGVDAARGRI